MLVFLLLAGTRSRAVSYLQEGFDYAPGILGTNAPWSSPTNLITVTSSNLTYPFLPDFSPPANAVSVAPGNRSVTYRPLTTVATNGCVYFSLLFNFTTLPGNYYIAGLTQNTNIPPGGAADDPLDLIDGGANNNFGVRAMGGSTSYLTNGSAVLTTNTTYLLVMKYNFTNGTASLYFNPPAGDTEPAAPDAISVAATPVTNLSYVYLRVGSSTAGSFLVSALRVASSWAEVTPATNNTTAVAQAAMLSSFMSALQVNNYWQEGYTVNWRTGSTNLPGQNMTDGTATHCSAYAAAVADLMGVYILRQPAASDINLANNQAIWLATNTVGWYLVSNMPAAQHLVNTGALVVASYYNPANPDASGHIAVLRPSNRTDASVNTLGPEESQSGDLNSTDTNCYAGFYTEPGAFPNSVLFYAHNISYPLTNVIPVMSSGSISNQMFSGFITNIVGRKYQIQWSSNLISWSALLAYTNSNNSANFFVTTPFSNSVSGSAQRFYRILAQ